MKGRQLQSPLAEEESAKKAKSAQEHQERAEKKYAEKLRLTEQKTRQSEEKAWNLEKAIGGASGSAADAKHTEEQLQQAILFREKELRVEVVAEAERQREAKLLGEKDKKHKDDLKGAFASNADLAKDGMHKQSAQLALMFNMHSQFTSLVAEAKKIATDLWSKDPDAVATAAIELSIHKGIVAGDIEPEEGEEGTPEKILELLAATNLV
ncbi:hypothetical protein CYMTET_24869 [Cymbomonas tetramitiformis]|uniref:Uncharacterized protein n=1 Tax=Cymbomonas tetramitiformis TaxID=36881 RepID=A0AAE0FVQ7_9CHLO|nr:hypothetical protein CYMTET_24869 [Cymbomonas tetramitiformis]